MIGGSAYESVYTDGHDLSRDTIIGLCLNTEVSDSIAQAHVRDETSSKG